MTTPRKRAIRYLVAALVGACSASSTLSGESPSPDAAAPPDAGAPLAVSVFSRTNGFRHDSIPAALSMLASQGGAHGWNVSETEDPAVFTASLAHADVVVFALTSGNDILDASQKAAFEAWVTQGHGFVGIHSATDTEYAWPFYHQLVGATFRNHPPGLYDASVDVVDSAHPIAASLPSPWARADEWYSFTENPVEAGALDVLLALDESTFAEDPALSMTPHPISWTQIFRGTRSFYTAMGHPSESYSDPTFVAFLARAIDWAGAR